MSCFAMASTQWRNYTSSSLLKLYKTSFRVGHCDEHSRGDTGDHNDMFSLCIKAAYTAMALQSCDSSFNGP